MSDIYNLAGASASSGPGMQSIWLPGRWPSLNAVYDEGIWKKVRVKKRWQDGTRLLIRVAHLRPVERAFLYYEHHRPDMRGDPSNYAAAAAKMIEDALVAEGVIPGDGFAHVAGFAHSFVLDRQKPGVRVRIEER